MREVGRAEHASTEQLSAWLDGRAEPDEQGFLGGHVEGCIVCSNELADLRSVRDLLRALPVYLPPRSFTIPIEAAPPPPRRFRRLIPLTRALGTVAAVLCVVLFSVDAMQTGYDAPASVPEGAGAMHLTTRATQEAAEAARPADAASKIANAPAAQPAAALAPAATQAPPSAPLQSIANTVTATPAGILARPAAESAPRAADAAASGRAESAAFVPGPPAPTVPAAPAERPAATSPWLSPIRLWSLGFALVAAALLIGSLVLSRISRARAGVQDEWTRS